MTTDSFPLRLDTSTGVIKFIETDSDDLIVLAAKCGQYLADTFDSTSKGRWELKSGTGDAGYVGTIVDTYYTNQTAGTVLSSPTVSPLITDTLHLGLISTNNVNQKVPPSGDAIAYPLRYDRTLAGLQEIGDSGGSDPAYAAALDAIISLIFQHDLPGVYRMAPHTEMAEDTFGEPIGLDSAEAVQLSYLDSDEWTLVLDLPQEFDASTSAKTYSERARIYQKTGITYNSETDQLIKSKRPDGGLRLLKKRSIGAIFLGVGTMAGNADTSTNMEMQEFFAGGLLNRIFSNQGQNRPGHFQITTSATAPAGYRNIGSYMDLRNAIVHAGAIQESLNASGPGSPGTFSSRFSWRSSQYLRATQGVQRLSYGVRGVPSGSRSPQLQRRPYNVRRVNRRIKYYSPSISASKFINETYYLHVKI